MFKDRHAVMNIANTQLQRFDALLSWLRSDSTFNIVLVSQSFHVECQS